MWPAPHHPDTSVRKEISAFGADALFVSALQRSDGPGPDQVRQAIDAAARSFGWAGCAERVAQEFGDHPETAAARMRWARATAPSAVSGLVPQPRRSADSITLAAA
jgi:hypothetical protein